MKAKTFIPVLLSLLALLTPGVFADSDVLNSETGMIQVYVQDDSGAAVANAPVYILDHRKTLTIKETNSLGVLSLVLQKGDYVLSSAITRPIADSIDRYTSPQARLRVVPQDTTSLVLTLHLGEDAISNLSLSTLQKIGVADEVAKYINN